MAGKFNILVRQSEFDSLDGDATIKAELANAGAILKVDNENNVQISRQSRPQAMKGKPSDSITLSQGVLNSLGSAMAGVAKVINVKQAPLTFRLAQNGGNFQEVNLFISTQQGQSLVHLKWTL